MNPFPLDDPRHNLVLLGKELLLLEGHLGDPTRHCPSCVLKHTLTASGLCDEARRMPGAAAWSPLWEGADRVLARIMHENPHVAAARQPDAEHAEVSLASAHVLGAVRWLRRQVLGAVLAAQRAAAPGPRGQGAAHGDRHVAQAGGGCGCGGKGHAGQSGGKSCGCGGKGHEAGQAVAAPGKTCGCGGRGGCGGRHAPGPIAAQVPELEA